MAAGAFVMSTRAVYASDECLTVGKAALHSTGGKDLKQILAEHFKCELL
jgi:hypothetical protein